MAKSLKDKLDETLNERYKEHILISRLKRLPNETVKSNALMREEVQRFPYQFQVPGRARPPVKSLDVRGLLGAHPRSLCLLS